MKNIFYLTLVILAFSACSKSEIATWDAKPRVWFTTANDTVVFTFYSQPVGTSEYIIELPITMAGVPSEMDREVTIKDLGSSPHNPGSKYEIVAATIPAGKVKGTAQIKVYKTENLTMAPDTLAFEIVRSDNFEVGLTDNLHNAIIISSTLAKPGWWGSTPDWWIGYYSDEKLELIYMMFGSEALFDVPGATWYTSEVQIAIYRLNRYCIDNDLKYADGTEIRFESYHK